MIKLFIQELDLCIKVLLIEFEFFAEVMDGVSWLSDAIFIIRLEYPNNLVANIEASIPYFLKRCQTSCLSNHIKRINNYML